MQPCVEKKRELSKCWDRRPGRITVNSEDTISWDTFGLVCGGRWSEMLTPALQLGVPRPTDRIGDRVFYGGTRANLHTKTGQTTPTPQPHYTTFLVWCHTTRNVVVVVSLWCGHGVGVVCPVFVRRLALCATITFGITSSKTSELSRGVEWTAVNCLSL